MKKKKIAFVISARAKKKKTNGFLTSSGDNTTRIEKNTELVV